MGEILNLLAQVALEKGGAKAAQILDGKLTLIMPFGHFVVSVERVG